MSRQPLRRRDAAVKLSMTPMIDVVFLLLVFFVLAMKQEDILSHLDARRPALTDREEPPPNLNRIDIVLDAQGCSVLGHHKEPEALRSLLAKQAGRVENPPIVIHCSDSALHGSLVQVLDICASQELNRIAIVSRN